MSATTILGIASPPTILLDRCVKKSTSESVWLTWEVEEVVADAINNYRVKIMSVKGSTTQPGKSQKLPLEIETTEDQLRIYDLLPGQPYRLCVSCHTDYGWSAYSDPVILTTLPALPVLEQAPTAKVIENSYLSKSIPSFSLGCELQWLPAKENGSAIEKYLVQVRSGPREYSTQFAWTEEDDHENETNEMKEMKVEDHEENGDHETEDENEDEKSTELYVGCRCKVRVKGQSNPSNILFNEVDGENPMNICTEEQNEQNEQLEIEEKIILGEGWVCEYKEEQSNDHLTRQARVLLDITGTFEWVDREDLIPLPFPKQAHVWK